MCGILGGFGREINSIAIEASLSKLFHRGPDSQGFKELPGECFMGVARLAMTDPHPRSDQPMVAHDGKFAISFNGEIYNFKDLRRNLQNLGINFQTESDTEVLLEMFRQYGNKALDRLEGMFAFAVYDIDNQKLTIARDKLGKKPLFFSIRDNGIFWSSSLDVLVNLVDVDFEYSTATYDFLSLGYQLDPNTGYKGIYGLLPGHYLEYQKNDSYPNPHKFPSANIRKNSPPSLREVLWKAIQVRIEGHQKIGLSLSGGIDSTLIALGLKELGIKADAFSAYWSNTDKSRYNSDAEHAKEISKSLKHEFHPVDISSEFNLRKVLRNYLQAMEEPNNNPSGLSTLALYKAVHAKNIRLLLTGDGSDEIFGGYARHELASKYPRFFNLETTALDRFLFKRKNPIQKNISNLIASQLSPRNPKFWLHWHLVFTPSETSALFRNVVPMSQITKTLSQEVQQLSPEIAHSNATQNLMKKDHEIWLSMESNKKLDRISMAFSIEARSPFQDENVISYAEEAMKQKNFMVFNKKILRDEFPELNRLPVKTEKVGFTSPIGHWMREDPDFVNDSIVYLSNLHEFDASYLAKFKGAQFRGDYRTNMQLWTLVVYANWLMVKNER